MTVSTTGTTTRTLSTNRALSTSIRKPSRPARHPSHAPHTSFACSHLSADAIGKWVGECQSRGVPCNPSFRLESVLGDAVKIRQWNIWGLPKDEFSTENGIAMDQGRRWPLCIDPQVSRGGGGANRCDTWSMKHTHSERMHSMRLVHLPSQHCSLDSAMRISLQGCELSHTHVCLPRPSVTRQHRNGFPPGATATSI